MTEMPDLEEQEEPREETEDEPQEETEEETREEIVEVPLGEIEEEIEEEQKTGCLRKTVEWIVVIVGAVLLSVLIRSFLIQTYYIPSLSMSHTLQIEDRVIVNKLSYRFGDVSKGDVVVFNRPEGLQGSIDALIKRVIAVPGETISFREGQVYVDGVLQDEPFVGGQSTHVTGIPFACDNPQISSNLCLVPENMVFVMGDNRNSSNDSRIFGPISIDSIVGRAFLKIWPIGELAWL